VQDIDEGDSAVIHHRFIKAALGSLVPVLLEQLMKQEDDQDKEDNAWNLAMAAGTCLDLIATVVEDEIISLVMPFVQVSLGPEESMCRIGRIPQPLQAWTQRINAEETYTIGLQ
jgi:importin subunit beta-1